MIRRLLASGSVLFLLRSLGSIGVWVFCTRVHGPIEVSLPRGSGYLMIEWRGGIQLNVSFPVAVNFVELPGNWAAFDGWVSQGEVNIAGFAGGKRRGIEFAWGKFDRIFAKQTGEVYFAGIPAWFPFLAAIVSTLLWWRAHRGARVVEGLCIRCGYDLRASKDRCPECGTPVPSRATAEHAHTRKNAIHCSVEKELAE